MTHRLPPDIDRMLWEIAESQDTHAYDDFEERFPQLVGELGKRIQLVRELRDARGDGSNRPVPRFDRRAPTRMGLEPKAVLALCAATIACIGFGAYVVTARLMNPAKLTPPEQVVLKDPGLSSGSSSGGSTGGLPTPHETAPVRPKETPESPNTPVEPYLVPQRLVTADRAKLQVAILMVATSGGLEVEFAPNMPNPEIRMEYHNMSALDILRDLGPRFHFTAIPDGRNRYLMIPTIDPSAARQPPAFGSGYAANLDADQTPGSGGPIRPKTAQNPDTPGPS